MSPLDYRTGLSSSPACTLLFCFILYLKGIPACRIGLDFRLHGSHRVLKSHAPVEGNVWSLFHCSFNVTKCNLSKVNLKPILVGSLSNYNSMGWPLCWWAKKFHTNDASLTHIWVVLLIGYAAWEITSTNQEHYLDLGSDMSSVGNSCTHFLDIILQANQWWRRELLAVFSV